MPDAMARVCGVVVGAYVGEDGYTLGYWDDERGERSIVHAEHLMDAVCELAKLMSVDLSDI